MSQENVEMARRSYEAWNRGDVDAASVDFAPDIEFDMSRAIGMDRGIYSLNQARRLMEEFLEAFDTIQVGAEYIDAGEHVVISFTTVSGAGKGSRCRLAGRCSARSATG